MKMLTIATSMLALALASVSAFATIQTVTMKSISYEPKTLDLKVGDKVEWINKSLTEHSATAEDEGGFDTGRVAAGKTSRKIEFSKPGTYLYHCTVHGKTMSGKIVVSP